MLHYNNIRWFIIYHNFCFFSKISNPLIVVLIRCIIANVLTIIPFHFFWLKNTQALLYISISSLIIDIYITVFTLVNLGKFYNYKFDDYNEILVITYYNYGIPSLVTALTLSAMILAMLIIICLIKVFSCGKAEIRWINIYLLNLLSAFDNKWDQKAFK